MNLTDSLSSRVTTKHRAKLACIYVRQSSPGQVLHNTESTIRQYALVERAVALGWPRDRVQTIDADMGKSGSTADGRSGFQHLMTEIGLARVGLVLSLEAARLARNNSDWYRLIELCSMFGALIADGERVYDPRAYHDRLLLGLAGMMSEAELHHLKMRLLEGGRNKAARGELRVALPAGLERLRTGDVILNPDEEVRARVTLVLEKFRELGSSRAVMRYLRREGLKLPTRPLQGPAPHEVRWGDPTTGTVLYILKNPAYAGAYVYGRRSTDSSRRTPGAPRSGVIKNPIDKWEVCLKDVYPAYISWDEYVANQHRLRSNTTARTADVPGAARMGRALLQGIILCGICGLRLTLKYSGPKGDFPLYQCSQSKTMQGDPACQHVRALALDAAVERAILEALEPDHIAIALGALEQLEREDEALERQWRLRIERARYETTRAQRQYDVTEPEHRLVARSLERQ